MSVFKKLEGNSSEPTKDILKHLDKILQRADSITEFSKSEITAISVLMNDKYVKPYLDFLLSNLKHVKRKHAKELLEMHKNASNMAPNGRKVVDKL